MFGQKRLFWSPPIVLATLAVAYLAIWLDRAPAQEDAAPSAAQPAESSGEGQERSRRRGGGPRVGRGPGLQGPPPVQAPPTEPKKEEKKEDAEAKDKPSGDKPAEDSGPKSITRPSAPPNAPNPAELAIKPDKDGKVQFGIRGQKWPDVLQFLADWSEMSLDWQELPDDYLNLTTPGKVTAREARDLINRHLLARGYTMLIRDNVLWVTNIKKLDPSMVPRVTPGELADRDPHEFVKVSFPLDSLVAETAVKELEPMKSPNGKLSALAATNRLEAMDAVLNLRQIYAVLSEEQSDEGEPRLVRTFVLVHTRAVDVREQLLALLGIDSKKADQPMTPQQMEQQMRAAQQMAQQQQQNPQQGGAQPPKKPEIFLVAIPRQNVVLANAPPDKMALIEQAIRAIDVPLERPNFYRQSVDRMQIYRLSTTDPEPLIKTLEEIGNLDPSTRLEVDLKNKAIIAYAPLPDHVIIRALVDKLDGSARKVHVRQLRRLDAEFVAGTIRFMMGGKQEEKQERRPRYYGFFDSYGRREEPTTQQEQFSVDADVVQNRLLLLANDDELNQVEDLLVQLGELPSRHGDSSTMRVIDAPEGKETEEWLEQIFRAWKKNGANPWEVDLGDEAPKSRENTEPKSQPIATPKQDATTAVPQRNVQIAKGGHQPPVELELIPAPSPPLRGRGQGEGENPSTRVQLAGFEARNDTQESAEPDDKPEPVTEPDESSQQTSEPSQEAQQPTQDAEEPATEAPKDIQSPPEIEQQESASPPPIRVSRAPDGRLIITCDDPKVLDQLESLMIDFPPPRKQYEVFKLKYASAYLVAGNLEDYFAEEGEQERSRLPFWARDDQSSTAGQGRLSQRRPVKFISDSDTNSILVQNAGREQLKVIEDLIEFYDQPEPPNSQSVRKMQIIKLRYSTAEVVAEAVKEVFIDLLSTHDKARQQNEKDDKRTERVYFYDYYSSGDDKQQQMLPRFKGQLSLGIDRLSNTLVVSAPEYVLTPVILMIRELDESARPSTTVQAVAVGRGVNATELQKLLANIIGKEKQSGQPEAERRPDQGPQQKGRQGRRGGGGGNGDNESSNGDGN